METIYTDRKIIETGCMLYMRIISIGDDITVYAFKHDEFRCDMEIFTGDNYTGNLEAWLLRPVTTDVSY